MTDGAVAPKVIAVVVTHRRVELLAESLGIEVGGSRGEVGDRRGGCGGGGCGGSGGCGTGGAS